MKGINIIKGLYIKLNKVRVIRIRTRVFNLLYLIIFNRIILIILLLILLLIRILYKILIDRYK